LGLWSCLAFLALGFGVGLPLLGTTVWYGHKLLGSALSSVALALAASSTASRAVHGVKSCRSMYGGRNGAAVWGLAVYVWCALAGVSASWLSGYGATSSGLVGSMVCVIPALVALGLLLGYVGSAVLDVGWLGSSLDRAGIAVCLVWLILFEGVFFFGAVWCFGLVVDLQGHSVGIWGSYGTAVDSGLGLGSDAALGVLGCAGVDLLLSP